MARAVGPWVVVLAGCAGLGPAPRLEPHRSTPISAGFADQAPAPAVALPEPEPPPDALPVDLRAALASDLARGLTIRGSHARRLVHFTFDDGPNEETTLPLLEALDRRSIRATFFVVGERLVRDVPRDLLREIARRGHTIGSHGYSHADLRRLAPGALVEEIERTESLIAGTLGDRPWLFRPPYGARSRPVYEALTRRDYTVVLWNLPVDGDEQTPRELLARFREGLDRHQRMRRSPGVVVLLHDRYPWLPRALDLLLDEIDARNRLLGARGQAGWEIAPDLRPFFRRRARAHPPATASAALTSAPRFGHGRAR